MFRFIEPSNFAEPSLEGRTTLICTEFLFYGYTYLVRECREVPIVQSYQWYTTKRTRLANVTSHELLRTYETREYDGFGGEIIFPPWEYPTDEEYFKYYDPTPVAYYRRILIQLYYMLAMFLVLFGCYYLVFIKRRKK
jgi:hypothetical protein